MALILSFGRARKTRVEINYFLYFFLSFADLLCLGGWTQLCKRPNSALIGWEEIKSRHVQSEIAMSTQRLNQDWMRQQISTSAQDSGAHIFNDFFRITAPSSIFFLQIESESRFRSNGVRNSLRMTVVWVIAVSLNLWKKIRWSHEIPLSEV